ncbi:metallophosphoesterase family protein [Gloeothece verrucosa]|uniref:Metallophosphoesterase n=1 Tax=Gloeothece verrucosa (strain PCC 7822) TaxID=497965 RepID=E0UA25_GLOV7|nr:metallophosphoesterase family protein [Gloeothece verrucosa]ADN16217.1 metallophosphoesterase [Gloeothece verrucosa PCC 7822]
MRTLAIGDIHGCLEAFNLLLDVVALRPNDTIITLGDYINKGPQSKGVIDQLIALHERGQLVALKGNHELMILEARKSLEKEFEWLKKYGTSTLLSYSNCGLGATLEDIPPHHWDFLQNICLDWWETKEHFFVHANIDSHLPLDQQLEDKLFWAKFVDPQPHYSGKVMICGHTSQKNGLPLNIGHAICLDTWVCGEGWLTCLDIDSGQIWQTNQQGKVRTAFIEDFYRDKQQKLRLSTIKAI